MDKWWRQSGAQRVGFAAAGVTDSGSFAITKSREIAKALEAEMETIVSYRPVNNTFSLFTFSLAGHH